ALAAFEELRRLKLNIKIGNSAFADGFVRSTLCFCLIHLAPFIFDNGIPADGCGYIGFPMIFYEECYWSGVNFEQFSLYFDIFIWLLVSSIVGIRWHKLRKHGLR
ncbi:hypothetical protein, partial [Algibacillus agarilyticus]|uniref:hypothetical protein n=1 Tax=Algibacillus agarilyticus TaxID=2234133 RepID=UPI001E34E9BD